MNDVPEFRASSPAEAADSAAPFAIGDVVSVPGDLIWAGQVFSVAAIEREPLDGWVVTISSRGRIRGVLLSRSLTLADPVMAAVKSEPESLSAYEARMAAKGATRNGPTPVKGDKCPECGCSDVRAALNADYVACDCCGWSATAQAMAEGIANKPTLPAHTFRSLHRHNGLAQMGPLA